MFMIGGALGAVEAEFFPHAGVGLWALVGLAGVLGGVMRSPFTGVVFALELTHQVGALLPLLIGASTAYAVSALVLKRSVLTEKVVRRGFHLTREYDVDPLEVLFVDEVIEPEVLTFDSSAPIADALAEVRRGAAALRQRLYPVLNQDGNLIAVVSQNQLEGAVHDGRQREPVSSIARRQPVCVYADDTLRQAVVVMTESGLTRLPVVDRSAPSRVVGLVSLQQLLAGRLKDLQEARESERVLRLRLFRFGRDTRDGGEPEPATHVAPS
jgi:CBS domain-containing protein